MKKRSESWIRSSFLRNVVDNIYFYNIEISA